MHTFLVATMHVLNHVLYVSSFGGLHGHAVRMLVLL